MILAGVRLLSFMVGGLMPFERTGEVGLLDGGLSGLECESLEFDSGFLTHLDEFLDESGLDGGVGTDFDGDVFEAGADGAVELGFLAEPRADLVERELFVADEEEWVVAEPFALLVLCEAEVQYEGVFALNGRGRASVSRGRPTRSSASS
jgi:hypothetical protein